MKPGVLQLIGSFHLGGSERQAVQLSRLLHESGRVRLHIACLSGDGALRAEVSGFHPGEIPEFPLTSFYDGNAVRQLRRLVQLLREREISIVQTHDFYTNVFGMAAAALARVPVRIASRRETGGMRTRAQQFVQHRAYRLAHAIVANAEAVRGRLLEEGVPARKIEIVYNGLDVGRVKTSPGFQPDEARAQFGLPADAGQRLVCIVANMRHEVKDQRTFLRAARRVRDEIPEAAFVLAGEGELMESLRAYVVELGLEREVFFTGTCTRVAELLAVSDVCVLSSTNEGFSNSILEYMAAARPVVATDVGGAREAVSDGLTGYVVQPGDDALMAARIISLLRDPVRARAMGEHGRLRVEQNFSCAAQLARTLELYERLLAASRVSDAFQDEPLAGRNSMLSERR